MVHFLLIAFFLTRATPSAFFNANNFLILLALLGPNLLGIFTSVNPGIGASPFLTTANYKTPISDPTIHPRTDFLFLCPSLLGLKLVIPFLRSNLTLPLTRTPYFIEKPALSLPPQILKTYPLNSSPN